MNNWGRICVGTRLEKQVEPGFFVCWTDLITRGLRSGDMVVIKKDRPAHWAANDVVREFLKTGCDSLCLIDSDADFGPNALNELRDHEAGWAFDALQAFYVRRGWPPLPIWFKHDGVGYRQVHVMGEVTDETAYVGLHFTLIRREVLVKLLGENDPTEFDWFYYPRNKTVSEDAAFSKDAVDAGFRLGATTALKTGHISTVSTGWETYQEWLEMNGEKARVERLITLKELIAGFTGETPDEAEKKIIQGYQNTFAAWDAPKGAEDTRKFYGRADNGYLYDLALWNITPAYDQVTAGLKAISGKDVLVVGGGIGGEVAQLMERNRLDVFELPGVLKDFLRYRFSDCIHLLDGESVMDAKLILYDRIVMVDVVEHIHPDEFDETMERLAEHLKPGGRFYIHANFGDQEKAPMHFDHHEAFEAWIKRHGLVQKGAFEWES